MSIETSGETRIEIHNTVLGDTYEYFCELPPSVVPMAENLAEFIATAIAEKKTGETVYLNGEKYNPIGVEKLPKSDIV